MTQEFSRAFTAADQLGDRVMELTPDQQNQLLWRLVYGHTDAVKAALAELESRGWQL